MVFCNHAVMAGFVCAMPTALAPKRSCVISCSFMCVLNGDYLLPNNKVSYFFGLFVGLKIKLGSEVVNRNEIISTFSSVLKGKSLAIFLANSFEVLIAVL